MNKHLREDMRLQPSAFNWYGELDQSVVAEAAKRLNVRLPGDLLDLWMLTGGGDLFESETVFPPIQTSGPDPTVGEANAWFSSQGLGKEYFVFQEGVFLSAVRLSDGAFVELDSGTFEETNSFRSMDDWYVLLIRPAFGARYGLPDLDTAHASDRVDLFVEGAEVVIYGRTSQEREENIDNLARDFAPGFVAAVRRAYENTGRSDAG